MEPAPPAHVPPHPTAHENVRVVLLVLLTFVTGVVDAVSFLALDEIFTANMTGNAVLLGLTVSGTVVPPLSRAAVVLVAFAVGAVVGGRATRRADVRVCWPPRVAVAILVACAIVAGVVVGWVGRDTPPAPDLLAALLAAAMGIQGGATRRLRVADLPTTVITSTMTGLASDSLLAGGEDQRWRRRLGAVVALLAGAVLGGVLSHGVHPAVGLLPAVAVLLGVGLAVVWPGIGPGRR